MSKKHYSWSRNRITSKEKSDAENKAAEEKARAAAGN